MNPFYTDYSELLRRIFGNRKVQKISIDAGLSCPNRDGTVGYGGCIYCDNRSFSPEYCRAGSVADQIARGKEFFGRKYPEMKFLAYFQAYTGTHAPLDRLIRLYEEAAAQPDIIGIIIGTRPDCLPDELLRYLQKLNRRLPVIVEFGAESSHDRTLRLINRGHIWSDTVDAVLRNADAGLTTGIHLIAGLPGESESDIFATIDRACALPLDTLKIHQLQVLCGTELARRVEAGEIELHIPSAEEYIDLCARIVARVPRSIAIERFVAQAPPEMLIAPKWGLKNYQFTNMLHNRLRYMQGTVR